MPTAPKDSFHSYYGYTLLVKENNLFKRVDIEKDWQKAVGFVLSEYASAYESKRLAPQSLKEIPTSIAVVYEGSLSKTNTHNAKLTPLLTKINFLTLYLTDSDNKSSVTSSFSFR